MHTIPFYRLQYTFRPEGETLIHKFSESLLHRKTTTQHQNRPVPVRTRMGNSNGTVTGKRKVSGDRITQTHTRTQDLAASSDQQDHQERETQESIGN